MTTDSHNPSSSAAHGSGHSHGLPLWGLFLALLFLTGIEVGLYEVWRHTASAGHPIMPKFLVVIFILAFTLPKALIVAVYFMHLKFEKQLLIAIAIFPYALAVGGIMAMTMDTTALKPRYNAHPAEMTPPSTGHDEHRGEHKGETAPAHSPAH